MKNPADKSQFSEEPAEGFEYLSLRQKSSVLFCARNCAQFRSARAICSYSLPIPRGSMVI
jgi:hypothetical protein